MTFRNLLSGCGFDVTANDKFCVQGGERTCVLRPTIYSPTTVPAIPAVQRLPDSGRSGTEPHGAGARWGGPTAPVRPIRPRITFWSTSPVAPVPRLPRSPARSRWPHAGVSRWEAELISSPSGHYLRATQSLNAKPDRSGHSAVAVSGRASASATARLRIISRIRCANCVAPEASKEAGRLNAPPRRRW